MGDFETNQLRYFTSPNTVDPIPTAWGIYKVASAAMQAAGANDDKLDELKLLVQDLGKTIGALKAEMNLIRADIGALRSELDSLTRGVLTVRIRQEKSLLLVCSRTLEIATIVARRIAADELTKLGAARPNYKIPIKDDPFAGAPELQ